VDFPHGKGAVRRRGDGTLSPANKKAHRHIETV